MVMYLVKEICNVNDVYFISVMMKLINHKIYLLYNYCKTLKDNYYSLYKFYMYSATTLYLQFWNSCKINPNMENYNHLRKLLQQYEVIFLFR
jgi:hypothetical protein